VHGNFSDSSYAVCSPYDLFSYRRGHIVIDDDIACRLKIDARSAFEIGDKYDSHVPILKLFYAFGPCRCTTRYLAVLDVHIVQHRHYPRITADILTGDYEFRIGPILYDLFDALQFCRRPPWRVV
jgi:hypothetical protein